MTTASIISRKKLPRWVTRCALDASQFAIFYGCSDAVYEFVFGFHENGRGCVAVKRIIGHTRVDWKEYASWGHHLDPEVLIAAGVEAMRRRGSK